MNGPSEYLVLSILETFLMTLSTTHLNSPHLVSDPTVLWKRICGIWLRCKVQTTTLQKISLFLKELIPWFTTGATAVQMRTVFDDYIGTHEKVNLDGTILKQLRQCSDLTFKPDGVLLDTRTRTLPPTAGKQTMASMLGGSEVPCPVNIWWTAAEDIERFIQDQSWATLKNKIRNAKLSKNDIVLKLKDFMDDHNAELNARDPALVSAHSGYFNDHFGHYPQRYHVNDVNDYHVDDYLYTYPRVGYGNGYGYGYEHVHPLMQPQLSTSSGNDSMQY
eukprot:854224_1